MAEFVTVKVSEGIVRGKRSTTKNGGTYYSFQGIPYANPPVGVLRFKPPETPDSWNGVRDAHCLGSPCSHINKFTGKMDGSEDCLYLNVYTSELPPDASSRAVLVFIHGGGFVWGSGGTDFYGPDILMSSDVVLVTFNYRLGVLGFLRLDGSDVSPNNGMKDQVAALRWVSRNIAKFGGDPHNVTIFGESAGGVCVNYHLLSPLSQGLFHRAIAMSGSVYCSWALDRSCHGRARRLGEELGCHSDIPQSLAEFLRTVPVTQLVMAQRSMLSDKEKDQDFKSFCCPSVESQTPEAFLPQDPDVLLKQGKFSNVPIMAGITSGEGKLAYLGKIVPKPLSLLNEKFEMLVPPNTSLEKGSTRSQEISNRIKRFYFGDQDICEATHDKYLHLMCDKLISYGVHRMVAELSIRSSQPVFYYQFSYDGDWGFLQALGERAPGPGAAHGDELFYLFQSDIIQNNIKPGSPQKSVSLNMVQLWTNFAKTGDPSRDLDVKWSPYTKLDHFFMNIDTKLNLQKDLNKDRMAFWEHLYKEVST